jgi:hypothetical protein
MTPTGTTSHQDPEDEPTGSELADTLTPEAQQRAQEEFSHLAPGPSEPLHFGDEGILTELEEDPISEGGSSRESRL